MDVRRWSVPDHHKGNDADIQPRLDSGEQYGGMDDDHTYIDPEMLRETGYDAESKSGYSNEASGYSHEMSGYSEERSGYETKRKKPKKK